jgi:translocation and assembly module TamA
MARFTTIARIFVVFSLTVLSGCLGSRLGAGIQAFQSHGIKYRAEIRGVEEAGILRRLESVSELISPNGALPPENSAHLSSRAERDAAVFSQVLRSEGYYGARVSYSLYEKEDHTAVVFIIECGQAYIVEELSVEFDKSDGSVLFPEPRITSPEIGSRITSEEVIASKETVLKKVRSQGFPFARIREPAVVIDHNSKKARVRLLIETGPRAFFGAISFKGLREVKEEFARGLLGFREGELFDPERLDDARKRLFESGLFSMARIDYEDNAGTDGKVPVTVEVVERKHRSVTLGSSYRTDERFGVKVSWEDRNLRGGGERLSAEAKASGMYAGIETSYLIPAFMSESQRLKLHSNISEDRPDAYTSRAADLRLLLERRFLDVITAGAGVGLKISRVEQQGSSEEFTLISVPLSLTRDTSDDVFDPGSGTKAIIQAAPVHDLGIAGLTYLKTSATGTYYLTLASSPRLVLAARASAGSILGQALQAIPADERFYAGGGGSIRGYAFQSVGPVSSSGSPIGGRSLLETSLELRGRLSERTGFVLFADGGGSFSSRVPLKEEHFRWAVGVGIRYFTPVGPLRADIGLPLERREGIDDSYQFYVSIGQAF